LQTYVDVSYAPVKLNVITTRYAEHIVDRFKNVSIDTAMRIWNAYNAV